MPAKLSDESIREISRLHQAGCGATEIANRLGVSRRSCNKYLLAGGPPTRGLRLKGVPAENLVGRRFGRWLVESHGSRVGRSRTISGWNCLCQCGTRRFVATGELKTSQSCGCFRDEVTKQRATTHGLRRHPLYMTWSRMRRRCTCPTDRVWKWYGGRGVKICETLAGSFEDFLRVVGSKPSEGMSLDRVNVEGHYSCGQCQMCLERGWALNVRWADQKTQVRNRRITMMVTRCGECRPLVDWCSALGVKRSLVWARLGRGWDIEDALTTPRQRVPRSPEESRMVSVWRGMIARCHLPNTPCFPSYGGRGIAVCDRWRESYRDFLSDMGMRPSPDHQIHRINNDGPYSPENCAWVTRKEQSQNKRPGRPLRRTIPRHLIASPKNLLARDVDDGGEAERVDAGLRLVARDVEADANEGRSGGHDEFVPALE